MCIFLGVNTFVDVHSSVLLLVSFTLVVVQPCASISMYP